MSHPRYAFGITSAPPTSGAGAPIRLLDHLVTLGLRGNAAREALRSGKVLINGIPMADGGREVDPARVRYDPNVPRIVVGRDASILWFDATMAVVWKPPHMLAVPAAGRQDTNNVLRFVGQRLGTSLAVHRLDEETSGLMMVARTNAAQEAIKALLEAHAIERGYLAIVKGVFPVGPPRELRTTIVRDRGDGKRGSVGTFDPEARRRHGDSEGQLAITWVTAAARAGRHTVVEARLETGRTHQVRIHLAETGHPVLGDPLYADKTTQRLAPRLALHAARLAFTHPFTAAKMHFEAPLADDLEMLRRRLIEDR